MIKIYSFQMLTKSTVSKLPNSAPYALLRMTRRFLNRLLFESHEIQSIPTQSGDPILIGELPSTDVRYKHVVKILKLQENDDIKTGIVNIGMNDRGTVHYRNPLSNSSSTQLSSSDQRKLWITVGPVNQLQQVPRPNIDLVLALPRPLRFEKILTMVGCLGVHRLVLVNANKVEKDYFGSHLLRPERRSELNNLLIEGISQAAIDYHLPEVHICRYFNGSVMGRIFGEDLQNVVKLIAHPLKSDGQTALSLFDAYNLGRKEEAKQKVIVAIGAEGGWEDTEITAYEKLGFRCFHVGRRILRTDIAVNVILGTINQLLDE